MNAWKKQAVIGGMMFGQPVIKMEVERSTETDEMDDEKQVVWINGELVKDETEVVES